MKYSVDTYRLYSSEKIFASVIRTRVRMKETVDPEALNRRRRTAELTSRCRALSLRGPVTRLLNGTLPQPAPATAMHPAARSR